MRIKVIKKSFTIVEMMVVIAIVGILLGMMVPALGKARARAKYVRWLAFNAQSNRDPDTIINYNFEAMDFQAKINGTYYPVLYSRLSITPG
jgi:prepilin-type N-terminal cleavage/methylation domain-containing protein